MYMNMRFCVTLSLTKHTLGTPLLNLSLERHVAACRAWLRLGSLDGVGLFCFRVLGFVGASGVDHSNNQRHSLSRKQTLTSDSERKHALELCI